MRLERESEPHLQAALAAASDDPAEIRVRQAAHRFAEQRRVEDVLGFDTEFNRRPPALLQSAEQQVDALDLRSANLWIRTRAGAEGERLRLAARRRGP